MYIYTHSHIVTGTYTHLHTYTPTHTHIHSDTSAHSHIHMHSHAYTCIHIYSHIYTHLTHIHKHSNTRIHVHTYLHRHTLRSSTVSSAATELAWLARGHQGKMAEANPLRQSTCVLLFSVTGKSQREWKTRGRQWRMQMGKLSPGRVCAAHLLVAGALSL